MTKPSTPITFIYWIVETIILLILASICYAIIKLADWMERKA